MLLKLPTFKYADCPTIIDVKRPKSVRDQWVEFYETGGRVCQVSDGCVSWPCVMMDKPISIPVGSLLSLKLQPISITEVWSGVTSRLSSVYIRVNGKSYTAQAMNGWRFRETDTTPLRDDRKPTSPEAKAVVNQHFLSKDVSGRRRNPQPEPLFEKAS